MDPVLSSILGPVCERLLDAALKEYRLVRGVKEETRNLASMIEAVRDVLEDAGRKQGEDTRARTWLKALKQLLLDAEDVLDEIATDEALRAKRDAQGTRSVTNWRHVANIFRSLSCLCSVSGTSGSRAVAHQIKDINKRFDAITRVKDRLGLVRHELGGNRSSTAIRPEWRETSSVLRKDAHIVGRTDDMSKMKHLLLESPEGEEATCGERDVQVICVVGMGGTGKTTLVQHVYNDPEVTKHFQFTKWVCVSNDFDVRRIAGEVMGKEEGNRPSNLEAALVDLRELIQGKRFFLVLDDVWEENSLKWGKLYDPLSHGAEGSKIVVTTRSETVSSITKGTQIVLKDLSNDDLWSIFQQYAFEGRDPENKMQLISVGRQIVKKLKGSPLAAKIIGGLLNSNMDVRHWTNIQESETLLTESKGDKENDMLRVLKLSYDHLPGHLKQCFSYCSLFPEDHWFEKHELVQLWMAQQFMDNSIEGSDVKNVGEDCFDYLVHASLFEKQESYDDDGVQYYVMHDLIHELADSVSKDDCLILMEDPHPKAVHIETIRHISVIDTDLANLLRGLSGNYEKLRTLLFMKGSNLSFSCDDLNLLFMKLPRLRALSLQSCCIKELPKSIGKLKHLRYLDLSRNYNIKELPKSLCNLYKLQVLDLSGCDEIRALPSDMSGLINLRHLLPWDWASRIRGLGKLTALHELTLDCRRRSGGQPILKELQNMNMIRQLKIQNLEGVEGKEEAEAARLHQKSHLEELAMIWRRYHRGEHEINPELEGEVLECLRPPSSIRELTIKNYGGTRSPSWMEHPSWVCPSNSLETLEMEGCMNWEILLPLGRLPCLKTLKIKKMNHARRLVAADDQYSMDGTVAFFPSLEELVFEDMEEREEWKVPSPLLQSSLFLPRLQKLRIHNCPKLRQLPPLPPSLKQCEIYGGIRSLSWMEDPSWFCLIPWKHL